MTQLDCKIIIVGAGLSGIGMGIMLKKNGIDDFIILERENDIGGTWYTHSYPGVSPDIFSFNYAYSFDRHFKWPSLFAGGQDIHAYLKHCIFQYRIEDHIQLNSNVQEAFYIETEHTWALTLSNDTMKRSQFLINASSIFNRISKPNISGLKNFKGEILWPQQWNKNYSLNNKHVAIIGTGATAIQIIPMIEKSVTALYVYQRSANWILPKYNLQFSERQQTLLKFIPFLYRLIKSIAHFIGDLFYFSFLYDKTLPLINRYYTHCVLKRLRQVNDPCIRKQLTPGFRLGCRRPLISSDYYSCFNKPHVTLITNSIQHIETNSITTVDNCNRQIDALICATGYDVHEPGNFPGYPVYGLAKLELEQYWQSNQYQAYSGIALPGFPNFFMTSGPYSLGFNWFAMTEANMMHIVRVLNKAIKQQSKNVMVKTAYHQRYHNKMLKHAKRTAFQHPACHNINSYFQDPHGETSLSSPHTATYRKWFSRLVSLKAFEFA